MIAAGSLILSIVFAASTKVNAQASGLTSGLSSGCQSAATSLISSDFATCANVIGLVGVVGASGSVVPPLNNWIKSVCSSAPCSSATLSSAQSTIQSGCQSDIASGQATAVALNSLIGQYPQVRDLLCLQATSNSSFCVPDTLTNVQTATNTNITVSEVTSLISGGTTALLNTLSSVPTSAYCTDCGHAIFSVSQKITTNVSSSGGSAASSAITSKCGASFADGQIPSTVREASSSSSSSNTTSSSSSSSSAKPSSAASSAFTSTGAAGIVGAVVAGVLALVA